MPVSLLVPDVQMVLQQARQARGRPDGPFPSPDDWRDQWIYFLLVDRFNNPQQPPRTQPWDGSIGTYQGGSFNGVRERLDYLQDLGVGAIWLSPVLQNCLYNPYSYHGYGIQNFLAVDP